MSLTRTSGRCRVFSYIACCANVADAPRRISVPAAVGQEAFNKFRRIFLDAAGSTSNTHSQGTRAAQRVSRRCDAGSEESNFGRQTMKPYENQVAVDRSPRKALARALALGAWLAVGVMSTFAMSQNA